ncbi:hypothetical protein ASE85_05540 [Sphingobium sp. Leaf26]|uniref:hypothetical protein n=1 Tax=Sphingobium sp. Leaf26 TaxID=1735693 RepID=UPI0006F5D4DB|nr:hypothetical protein [Sphingobium sp. Leaf26]KQN04497.1 hypothetical protein ASE85_05540 [Sphingobium sp. Leaf26]
MRESLVFAMLMMIAAPAMAAGTPAPAPAPGVAPAVAVPTLTDSRGLSCTADDRSVREIVIDFTGGRWRDAGGDWNKIAAQDDATITLVNQGGGMLGGILSDLRRVETLDRATLMLSTQLHTGLIDEARSYRCKIVAPFDARRQI